MSVLLISHRLFPGSLKQSAQKAQLSVGFKPNEPQMARLSSEGGTPPLSCLPHRCFPVHFSCPTAVPTDLSLLKSWDSCVKYTYDTYLGCLLICRDTVHLWNYLPGLSRYCQIKFSNFFHQHISER